MNVFAISVSAKVGSFEGTRKPSSRIYGEREIEEGPA
jgi:hypothetical protein